VTEVLGRFDSWLDALEKRHLADLRLSEFNRAVRALSNDYVHRRHRVAADALSGRGKRAAFALFFAPLHFLVVRDVARALSVGGESPPRLLDLGCGTGAAAAAVGTLYVRPPFVHGIDRQGWLLDEAELTYRHFGLRHRVTRGDIRQRLTTVERGTLVIAAYTINEIDGAGRRAVLDQLLQAVAEGASLLVVEPIARTVAPWWSEWSTALRAPGAREDEWRFAEPLPYPLKQMDRAAGLDHSVRKARTLWVSPGREARSLHHRSR
jgi:hypothetical protein